MIKNSVYFKIFGLFGICYIGSCLISIVINYSNSLPSMRLLSFTITYLCFLCLFILSYIFGKLNDKDFNLPVNHLVGIALIFNSIYASLPYLQYLEHVNFKLLFATHSLMFISGVILILFDFIKQKLGTINLIKFFYTFGIVFGLFYLLYYLFDRLLLLKLTRVLLINLSVNYSTRFLIIIGLIIFCGLIFLIIRKYERDDLQIQNQYVFNAVSSIMIAFGVCNSTNIINNLKLTIHYYSANETLAIINLVGSLIPVIVPIIMGILLFIIKSIFIMKNN